MDKRDKRIDLRYAFAEALGKNEKLREVHPNSTGYIWRTQRDERVRALHEILEGEFCLWDDPPIIGIDTGGIEIHGHPGEAWNCRCWAQIIEEPVQPVSSQQQQPLREIKSESYEELKTEEVGQFSRPKIIEAPEITAARIPITKTKEYKKQIEKYVRIIMKALKTSKEKLFNLPKSIYSSIVWRRRK